MQSAYEIKKEICEIGKRIYQNGFVAANDGNISVKVGPNEFYCTPTGVSKGYMTPDMICHVDAQGKLLENCRCKPSSEFKVHLKVYEQREDVRAVVHAHPPTATAFAVAHVPLDRYNMAEASLFLGAVPTCDYGTPSTDELPNSMMPYLQDHDAFLLANHGAVTVGATLEKAYFNMETLEFYAKVTLMAKQLGGDQELSCEEIEKLLELRKKFQVPGRHPGCAKCKNLGTENCRCKHNYKPLADEKREDPNDSDFKAITVNNPISKKTEENADYIDSVTAKVLAELYK